MTSVSSGMPVEHDRNEDPALPRSKLLIHGPAARPLPPGGPDHQARARSTPTAGHAFGLHPVQSAAAPHAAVRPPHPAAGRNRRAAAATLLTQNPARHRRRTLAPPPNRPAGRSPPQQPPGRAGAPGIGIVPVSASTKPPPPSRPARVRAHAHQPRDGLRRHLRLPARRPAHPPAPAHARPARRPRYLEPESGCPRCKRRSVLCAFCWVLDTLPGQCLRRRPRANPLSLMLFELSGYYVNTVQLHVHAADVLVRRGLDRDGSR